MRDRIVLFADSPPRSRSTRWQAWRLIRVATGFGSPGGDWSSAAKVGSFCWWSSLSTNWLGFSFSPLSTRPRWVDISRYYDILTVVSEPRKQDRRYRGSVYYIYSVKPMFAVCFACRCSTAAARCANSQVSRRREVGRWGAGVSIQFFSQTPSPTASVHNE